MAIQDIVVIASGMKSVLSPSDRSQCQGCDQKTVSLKQLSDDIYSFSLIHVNLADLTSWQEYQITQMQQEALITFLKIFDFHTTMYYLIYKYNLK
jgi:hypothetical protein